MTAANKITVGRIAATPLIAWLIFQDPAILRILAFVVFVVAAVSDVIDGNLARDKGEITRTGQILDPIADKLLILVTFIPLYQIGYLPLWLVVLVLLREVLITLFRRFALRRGQLIAASGWGKSKALVQNFFVGSVLLLRINDGFTAGGVGGVAWDHWNGYTRTVIDVGFWFVVVLTVLSMIDYLVVHRRVWTGSTA